MSATVHRRRQLPVIVAGVALVVLIMLLPDLGPPSTDASAPVQAYHGRIIEIVPADRGSTAAGNAPVATAEVEIIEGARTGEVLTAFMEGPGGSQLIANYQPGDEVVLVITQNAADAEPYVAVADHWRTLPLQVLVALFAIAVIVVGGWRGVRALIALGLTMAVILKVILPLILRGVPPLPMAVAGATAITAITILLTEGRLKSSIAAILGTAGSLSIAGLLAAAATGAAHFSYTSSDLAFVVTQGGNGLDLRGILLAAIILGAVGVLDDVTVTQAVVVDELAVRGSLRGRPLFSSALEIGRSHIGATVNTLFLAYVGASLPLLVVLLIGRMPGALVWNNEEIATEVVRTLAGSIGIVAAVPLTTFVATALVGPAVASGDAGEAGVARRPLLGILSVAGIAVVIGVLLVATAVVPQTQSDRVALPTEAPFIDPRDSGFPLPSDAGPEDSQDPGEEEPVGVEPVLAEPGEAVPIAVDGTDAGTVSVDSWAFAEVAGAQRVTVDVTYQATADWALDPSAWELLAADGTEVPLTATTDLPSTLAEGQGHTVMLAADTAVDLTDGFVTYVDAAAQSFVFLVALE